jgi:hypothetical protein
MSKCTSCKRIGALVKHEGADAKEPDLTGKLAELVRVLLHGVAHIGERRNRLLLGLATDMAQNLGDLRVAAAAADLHHEISQRARIRHEGRGAAFADAAEINELHRQPADACCCVEHPGLQLAGKIPGRLPAHRRVESKDEPAARARWRCDSLRLRQERVDLGLRGGRWR